MSVPAVPRLAMGMQLPVCETCLASSTEMRFMTLIVGRDFGDDHGYYWYDCKACGTLRGPYPCPLYWLSASNISELAQLEAVDGLSGTPSSKADCSPAARLMIDRLSLNPYLLAEAAAQASLELGRSEDRVRELEQRLADAEA